jgi:hypothetical protein
MQGDYWTINSLHTLGEFIKFLKACWEENKWLTVKIGQGRQRTLDQNGLFQVWAREFMAHIAGVTVKDVTKQAHEEMKTSLKRGFYRDHHQPFVIKKVKDHLTGETANGLRSTTDYSTGEMFMFMEWVQAVAANEYGLILEAQGEYKHLKQEQAA